MYSAQFETFVGYPIHQYSSQVSTVSTGHGQPKLCNIIFTGSHLCDTYTWIFMCPVINKVLLYIQYVCIHLQCSSAKWRSDLVLIDEETITKVWWPQFTPICSSPLPEWKGGHFSHVVSAKLSWVVVPEFWSQCYDTKSVKTQHSDFYLGG